MGFLGKKDQRAIRRVGNKAMKKTSLGLKKSGKLIAEEPVVITEQQVKMAGGQVRNVGKGVEKLRKGDLGGAMEKLAESRIV